VKGIAFSYKLDTKTKRGCFQKCGKLKELFLKVRVVCKLDEIKNATV
jgi:hypothetical protein